jgi:2-iminoacetate synthase
VSFKRTLDQMPWEKSALLRDFERLLAPKTDGEFEALAQRSQALTRQNFGRTMRLFAPLYLSNECINNCRYCGFSRDNPILRVTLDIEQVIAEARHLATEGFRQILLVAGEHPKFVSDGYLAECVRALAPDFSSIAIEVGPMETAEYLPIVQAGAEALVVYQETYNRSIYAEMHTSGPNAISIGDSTVRSVATMQGFAALASVRCSASHLGAKKRSHSPRTSITCSSAAGRRRSASACRVCVPRPADSSRLTR